MIRKVALPILGAFLCLTTTAMAAEEKISSLMYIPQADVFYGSTFAQYDRSTYDFSTAEITYQNTTLNQEIGFGLTDRLSYKIQASTILTNKTDIKDGAASSTSKKEGLREPGIEFKYRFDSMIPWASKFDMAVNYSPRIKDAKTANGTSKGLNLRGNHEIGATAAIGEEISSQRSWMAKVHVTYFTKTVSEPRNGSVPVVFRETDHVMTGELSFVWQEMLREDFGVNLGGEFSYISDIESTRGGVASKEDAAFSLGANAEAFWNYKTKIKYYGKVGLEKASDRDSSTGNTTVEVKSQWNSQAVLGAKYLF